MDRKQALKLISKLLEIAADRFSNHGCNDLPEDFFDGMDKKDIQDLYKRWHDWNGDPEEFNSEQVGYLGDDLLMSFFADLVKEL